MNALDQWAADWSIPDPALYDLRVRLGALDYPVEPLPGSSEAAVQSRVRLAASRRGWRVFRNNVGVDPETHVRYGLANDSAAVNRRVKSADLIGIAPRIVQPADVGCLIGQFVSLECKHGAWRYAGTEREVAQQNWASLVTSLGGIARFVSSETQV